MTCEPTNPFLQFVGNWQTLITGVLAVLAALGTVLATIASAKKEVASTQAQTEAMLRVERQRIAREAFSFFAMLEAAMATLIEDVDAARNIVSEEKDDGPDSEMAYAARQRLKKTAFADLRSAFLRFGGLMTLQFLRLDKEIDALGAQWRVAPDRSGTPKNMGRVRGLRRELDSIELRAKSLRDDAAGETKRCTALLAETESASKI